MTRNKIGKDVIERFSFFYLLFFVVESEIAILTQKINEN
jgi:hypothetical protein